MKPTIYDLRKFLADEVANVGFSGNGSIYMRKPDLGYWLSFEELESMVADHIERRQDVIGQNGNTGEHYKVGLTE